MRTALAGIAVVAALAAAGAAAGDGGPPQGAVQGGDGLARGGVRYVAVPVAGWTSVQAVARAGGRLLRFMQIEGSWGIPYVTLDSPGEALLRDDRTLILGSANSGGMVLRKRSSFIFVDTWRMRVVRRIDLRGHMTFDAISPDGRYLYLTEFVSPQDFTEYRVRAYDLRRNRLLAKIVSDRVTWETSMHGWPVSRVRRNGWALTLYSTGGRPFIHALDTRHVEATCIFLPWAKEPRRIFDYRLGWDRAGRLIVRGANGHALYTASREFAS
jgi:hypothetical protein